MVLTNRFAAPVREFLAAAATFAADGSRGLFVSARWSTARSPRHGARCTARLLDVGPHILDLVDAAVGEVVAVERSVHPSRRLAQLLVTHDNGARSVITIDSSTVGESRTEVELFGAAAG